MDPQAGGSLIPKRPVVETRRGGGGIFFALGLLLFIASIAAAGAVFAYQNFLQTSLDGKKESLAKTEEAFEPDVIETLVRTDKRIGNVQTLVGKHVAPSALFALLGELTLTSVRYDSFDFVRDDDGTAQVSLVGEADSFSSVALQSDQFGASKHLSNVVFSNIAINPSGRVDFTVEATASPSFISYARQLREPPLQIPADTLPATPAATTPAPAANSTPTP